MQTESHTQLPHWQMDVLYPSLTSDAFTTDFAAMFKAIETLTTLFDQHDIERTRTPPTGDKLITTFDEVISQYNKTVKMVLTIQSYVYSFTAVNSRNDVAQAKISELQQKLAQLNVLVTRLVAWLGCLDVPTLLADSAVAQAHAYMLQRAQIEAQRLMSPEQEALAADLSLTGSQSWYQLFGTYTSQLMVRVEGETVPLAAANKFYYSPDRDVRHRVHEAMQTTMAEASVPMAAALNSIKGETLLLAQRRGWDSPLAAALHDNAIDEETLTAMLTATRAAYPTLRRYLQARARYLGLERLAWYDRLVPLAQGQKPWSFEEAARFVTTQFQAYSPKMGALAERAFGENWIDAEPRDGKRGGAFCMWLREDESRILANFEPVFTSVSTLAHELGHAYHYAMLAERTPLQRELPMTLAETASTFCQKIVDNAALQMADTQDQLVILDSSLEYAVRAIMNASSDFLFEEMVFERRQQRALSADEFCELARQAQLQTFGDGLDETVLNPYRWVVTPHYYVTSYYNFPYTFGLLFGLGLYAQYQQGRGDFLAGYDDLLASTGMATAAELANRFGIDIRNVDFWTASLDVLAADIERFEALVA